MPKGLEFRICDLLERRKSEDLRLREFVLASSTSFCTNGGDDGPIVRAINLWRYAILSDLNLIHLASAANHSIALLGNQQPRTRTIEWSNESRFPRIYALLKARRPRA